MSESSKSTSRIAELLQNGEFTAALELAAQATKADFRDAEAWHYRGVAHHLLGHNTDAIPFIERAIRLNGDDPQYHYNLGVVYQALGANAEACACYRLALKQAPQHASAKTNLVNLLLKSGEFSEAERYCRDILTNQPNSVPTLMNLGQSLKLQGRPDESAAIYDQAHEVSPQDARIFSQAVFSRQYDPGTSSRELLNQHQRWWELFGNPNAAAIAPNREADQPIRLGFVSPDIGNHPVGLFLLPLLRSLDSGRFDVICFSDRPNRDHYQELIRPLVDEWHDTRTLNDQALRELILKSRIDVLFDLTGHTDNNRLPVFAQRAAAVQISWAGYVGTTGLRTMDYVLCDRFHVPPELEWLMVEQPLRMPHGYICYEPPSYAPEVAPLPAPTAGYVTFSCFNNPSKLNNQLIDTWAKILNHVPDSKLLLKYKGYGDDGVQERIARAFEQQGVNAGRLEFLDNTTHVEHLKVMHRVDIGLDPFPYSGGLTTCEMLWMGLPVVTRPGERFASRHAYSHCSNAECTQGIVASLDEYVTRAVDLAGDLSRLAEIRQALRPTMRASPLCDREQYARDFSEMIPSLLE